MKVTILCSIEQEKFVHFPRQEGSCKINSMSILSIVSWFYIHFVHRYLVRIMVFCSLRHRGHRPTLAQREQHARYCCMSATLQPWCPGGCKYACMKLQYHDSYWIGRWRNCEESGNTCTYMILGHIVRYYLVVLKQFHYFDWRHWYPGSLGLSFFYHSSQIATVTPSSKQYNFKVKVSVTFFIIVTT